MPAAFPIPTSRADKAATEQQDPRVLVGFALDSGAWGKIAAKCIPNPGFTPQEHAFERFLAFYAQAGIHFARFSP
jgi:hypothetical protein